MIILLMGPKESVERLLFRIPRRSVQAITGKYCTVPNVFMYSRESAASGEPFVLTLPDEGVGWFRVPWRPRPRSGTSPGIPREARSPS